jgi:O-antigen/teichoic acid export membrane protein
MDASEAPALQALSARSATVSIAAQLAARAITLAVVVGSTAIVARTLDVETYAEWATVISLSAMLAFVLDPGLTPVLLRRLAQETETVPRPSALVAVRVAFALLAIAAVCAISAALRGQEVLALALVLAAQAIPRALVLNAGAWLQADHRLHRQTVLEAVFAALGLLGLAVAAAAGASAVVLAAVGFLVPTALLAGVMARELAITPSRKLVVPGPQAERVRAVLREIRPLAGALLLVAVYTRLHVIFVNAAEDAGGVARFLFAWQFIEQALVVANIVAATLLPLLAARAAAHDLRRDPMTIDLLISVTALGALASALMVGFAQPITRLIGGPDLAGAQRDLTLLAPMVTMLMLAIQLGYVYLARGEGGRYLWFNFAALTFNLAGHAIFTLSYGADAAARVSWLTEAFVITLAFAPFWAAGARRPGLILLGLLAGVVLGAELAAGGVLPPLVAALIPLTAVAVLGRHRLVWLVTALRTPS